MGDWSADPCPLGAPPCRPVTTRAAASRGMRPVGPVRDGRGTRTSRATPTGGPYVHLPGATSTRSAVHRRAPDNQPFRTPDSLRDPRWLEWSENDRATSPRQGQSSDQWRYEVSATRTSPPGGDGDRDGIARTHPALRRCTPSSGICCWTSLAAGSSTTDSDATPTSAAPLGRPVQSRCVAGELIERVANDCLPLGWRQRGERTGRAGPSQPPRDHLHCAPAALRSIADSPPAPSLQSQQPHAG